MSMDLTGITNKNEYYTNHYFSTVFEENTSAVISGWNGAAKESEEVRTPWALLRQNARQYYKLHDRFVRSSMNLQTLANIRTLADSYLKSLGYPEARPEVVRVDDSLEVPIYLEMTKENGAPLLWVLLAASREADAGIMESYAFPAQEVPEDAAGTLYKGILGETANEDLVTKILFGCPEPPRFVMLMGMNQIALIDRSKWNEKRYLQFELEEIFSRLENTTLQAMAVLLHKDSLCPEDGKIFLDELDEQSRKNASGVSQDLKYALRECIELLGNEVLYDRKTRLGRDLETDPVDPGQLTLECLRYMYRMLFVLFIESRPELGYAPIKAQSYYSGYSLESLRDIADNVRDDTSEVGNGYYLHETLGKLYELIYDGYPKTEEELKQITDGHSLHDMFLIAPLKAHIFDPDYTKMIQSAKLRNSCMLRIIDLMSLTRSGGRRNNRRGRISYANLGINQMGAVYEALLSYRGFIAEHDLYEVKRAGDSFNELDVGYFVSESELDQYTEEERVRYESGEKKGKLRMYEKGTFIYRLAGREREKSASYYTPEVLTKCLVKYALKELLEGKTADEILELTVCEPAMGSAAFLNEAINQLAENYISRKEQETGEIISYENRFNELQKVKMYIADRNVYGIDLNPVAVELAEVSLWLNTIYEGGFVPWFGTQLVNGNSLIGARRQVYRIENAQATSKGMRWYEMEPERLSFGTERADKGYKFGRKQIYHFLLGDPGMCSYSDKVVKSLEPDKIKAMARWNKKFTEPITDDEIITLLRLSTVIDDLWEAQIRLRKEVGAKTQDALSIFGHTDDAIDSRTTIRQKDKIYSEFYKSEHMRNAGPYARLKFAMDYWCALWFWPIENVELLPSRSEFLFDMSLILEGTTRAVVVTDATTDKKQTRGQLSLFPTEMQQLETEILNLYEGMGEVDIPALRRQSPRLNLAAGIAEQNKFMHWELEFADLFAERGGFDLILGNPPWIRLEWNEQDLLSDVNPMFAIKNLTATQAIQHRNEILRNERVYNAYFSEYVTISGEQVFLNAPGNYPNLVGMKANLYKCFLPQAWHYGAQNGISAFVHPDGVFDDPKGGLLREDLYPRIRKHFQFTNELRLFQEVDHHTGFSLNIYSNKLTTSFEIICNLFTPKTIEECYSDNTKGMIPGLKDDGGNWNVVGHPGRVVTISKAELQLFARLFDDTDNWMQARVPIVHADIVIKVMKLIDNYEHSLAKDSIIKMSTVMWDETKSQKDGIIFKTCSFPDTNMSTIYSGPHIGLANPIFKTSRRVCDKNSDYDNVDLLAISEDYVQRFKYSPVCETNDYTLKSPDRGSYIQSYRVVMREMLNLSGERSLVPAIIPPYCGHIITVFGIQLYQDVFQVAGVLASIVSDFYIKAVGRGHCQLPIISSLPHFSGAIGDAISVRSGMLNCLNTRYKHIWKQEFKSMFCLEVWGKRDCRLDNHLFSGLSQDWNWDTPLRTDYERRQALIEIDVLSAMALGLSLKQLKTIYRIQFPVLQSYEADTWYDINGRIVFTNNRSLTGVGVERKEWENIVKNLSVGDIYTQVVTDDTMPGGSVERTIEYVAPFDRCDREKDYETAWKFFEEKYRKIAL